MNKMDEKNENLTSDDGHLHEWELFCPVCKQHGGIYDTLVDRDAEIAKLKQLADQRRTAQAKDAVTIAELKHLLHTTRENAQSQIFDLQKKLSAVRAFVLDACPFVLVNCAEEADVYDITCNVLEGDPEMDCTFKNLLKILDNKLLDDKGGNDNEL